MPTPSSHCSIKTGKAGKGAAHAAYIAGVGKYAEREDVVGIFDKNMPSWAKDGVEFFTAADKLERANGRTYTEIEAAIPRAVADPVTYATEYAEKLLGTNHPYRLAVHDKPAADGGRNIHMHLMFSERKLDGIERDREQFFKRAAAPYRDRKTKELMPADPAKGGAAKDRKWNDRKQIQAVRDGWQEYAKTHGVDLDLRSNAAKGLGEPEPKLGPEHPRATENPARQARKAKLDWLREVRAVRVELQEINHQLATHEARQAALAQQERIAAEAVAKAERRQRRLSGTPNRVIRLDQSVQAGRTEYRWAGNGPSAGKVAVVQQGNQLAAAGRYSAPKAAAMAQIAKGNGWKSVKITGDDKFKAMALPEFLARGIAVSNPELQHQVQAFQAKAQAEQQAKDQAAAAEADRQAMAKYLMERAERDAARKAAADARQAAAEARQAEVAAAAKIEAEAKAAAKAEIAKKAEAWWADRHAEEAERAATKDAAEIARQADLSAMLRGEPLPSVMKAQAAAKVEAETRAQADAQRAALEQTARRGDGAKLPTPPAPGPRLPSPGKGGRGR